MGKDPKIVTFIDQDYLPIFDLWNRYFFRHGHNVKTISLEGIIEIDKSNHKNFHKSLRYKNEHILKLLKSGENIIHSDLDAFWLNDPVKDLIRGEMVFSTDPKVSEKAVEQWGFGLCFGLYYIESNKNTIALFEYFIEEWLFKYSNDQKAFNHMLLNRGISWEDNKANFMNVEISVVDEKIASRKDMRTKVYHPDLGTNSICEKIMLLSSKGIR